MCSDMSLTPKGALEGIDEHKRKINRLIGELEKLRNSEPPLNHERMDEIQREIAYRDGQKKKLEDFLVNQSRN